MKKRSLSPIKTSSWLKVMIATAMIATSCTTDNEELSSNQIAGINTSALSAESTKLTISGITSDTDPQDINLGVENLIDGDLDSRWAAEGEEVNLDLNLGGIYNVDHIDMSWYEGDEYIYNFEVYSSNDGENFTLISSESSTGTTEDVETYDLPNDEYKYLRIRLLPRESVSGGDTDSVIVNNGGNTPNGNAFGLSNGNNGNGNGNGNNGNRNNGNGNGNGNNGNRNNGNGNGNGNNGNGNGNGNNGNGNGNGNNGNGNNGNSNIGDSTDDGVLNSIYELNVFGGEVVVVEEEPISLQNAFITDTSDADTGELRLDLSESLVKGKMSVTISKEATQNGFINLSGTSTTRRNALIDLRINDSNGYDFTESGDSVNAIANFPDFINDELVEVVIEWDATDATDITGPLVSVTIDGQDVTDAEFASESQDLSSVVGGVRTIQFRLGGNGSFDDTGAGMLVDNLKVYDTSSVTPVIVFEDDFEDYTVGNSLDPNAATASAGPIANAISAVDSPYRNNSFQVTVQGEVEAAEPVIEEPVSLQNAFITDTSDADTGELRLNLSEGVAKGKMSVTISKEATQNGFINLSGTSTSRANALIDMRISDSNGYGFTESGDSVNAIANFPDFINNELVEVVIEWDATVGEIPLVSVTIDGQAVTDTAFPSESQDPISIANGVQTVQFRLGGNGSFDDTGAGMLVDNLKVYDTSSDTSVIVFEDDFESYTVGYSLDPNAATASAGPIADAISDSSSPYRNNSFQVIVQGEGGTIDPVMNDPIEIDPYDDIIKTSPFGFSNLFEGDDFQVDNDGDGAHNWNAREYDEEPIDNGFNVQDYIFVTDNRLILKSPNSAHNENDSASRRRAEYRDQVNISLDDAHSMDFVYDIQNYDNSSELIMAQLHNDNTGARRPYITVLAEEGNIRIQRTNAPTGSSSLRSEEVIPFRSDSRYRITIETAAGDRSIFARVINLTTGEQVESIFEAVPEWDELDGDFYWKFGAYMPDGGSTNTQMRMESIEITGQQ